MTLRSRLSAAWKAFKQDDFPPPTNTFHSGPTGDEPFCLHQTAKIAGAWSAWYSGPTRNCPTHGTRSMADEAMKIRAELEDMHSTLTPDNAEPVKLTKRPRRKLASVPKE